MADTPDKKPLGQGTMTRKRFYEIKARLEHETELDVATVMNAIQDVLNFDPDASLYNQKRMEQNKAYRERKKAEGISTYLSTGAKNYYYRQKAKNESKSA